MDHLALVSYRKIAEIYDAATQRIESARCEAIQGLLLQPGFTVLDIGCGTGKSFALIQRDIGPGGRLIGIEQSPEMLALARRRIQEDGWTNVTLIQSAVEDIALSVAADALLFCYTHDILRSPHALQTAFRCARRGAAVAAAGTRYFPWWLAPANWYLRFTHRDYISNFDDMRCPWSLLQQFVPDLRVRNRLGIAGYVARGSYDRPFSSIPAVQPAGTLSSEILSDTLIAQSAIAGEQRD
jgi:ubiquinone/menaquinone biosynthesis C-methylase UbiE